MARLNKENRRTTRRGTRNIVTTQQPSIVTTTIDSIISNQNNNYNEWRLRFTPERIQSQGNMWLAGKLRNKTVVGMQTPTADRVGAGVFQNCRLDVSVSAELFSSWNVGVQLMNNSHLSDSSTTTAVRVSVPRQEYLILEDPRGCGLWKPSQRRNAKRLLRQVHANDDNAAAKQIGLVLLAVLVATTRKTTIHHLPCNSATHSRP